MRWRSLELDGLAMSLPPPAQSKPVQTRLDRPGCWPKLGFFGVVIGRLSSNLSSTYRAQNEAASVLCYNGFLLTPPPATSTIPGLHQEPSPQRIHGARDGFHRQSLLHGMIRPAAAGNYGRRGRLAAGGCRCRLPTNHRRCRPMAQHFFSCWRRCPACSSLTHRFPGSSPSHLR